MEDFLKSILRLDYVDCFVNIAEIKMKLLNLTDEQIVNEVNNLSMGSATGEEVDNVIAEFMMLGKLEDESRQSLNYYIMNNESFTALCADKEEEVALFV